MTEEILTYTKFRRFCSDNKIDTYLREPFYSWLSAKYNGTIPGKINLAQEYKLFQSDATSREG